MSTRINTNESISEERDDQLFLLLERDFPSMKSDIDKITGKIDTIQKEMDSISKSVDELKLLTKKNDMPWWRDFQQLLILAFAIGYMILAGVKAYEGVVDKVVPGITITDNGATQ